jgi:hypothetical protein
VLFISGEWLIIVALGAHATSPPGYILCPCN